jgi:hypothetical protein
MGSLNPASPAGQSYIVSSTPPSNSPLSSELQYEVYNFQSPVELVPQNPATVTNRTHTWVPLVGTVIKVLVIEIVNYKWQVD